MLASISQPKVDGFILAASMAITLAPSVVPRTTLAIGSGNLEAIALACHRTTSLANPVFGLNVLTWFSLAFEVESEFVDVVNWSGRSEIPASSIEIEFVIAEFGAWICSERHMIEPSLNGKHHPSLW